MARLCSSLAWLALVGCYRESTVPLDNTADRALRQPTATCSQDDLRRPPYDADPEGRLRSHTTGPLTSNHRREWTGDEVPDHVEQKLGTLELFILDRADGGVLAFYREPYGLGSCQLGSATNCAYVARFYESSGRMAWTLPLNSVLSRPDHLEIEDIRLAAGVLYFNEACQSYAADAQGTCSSLVAVDPRGAQVLWRTRPLVSNGRFRLRGCYIIAGYGFTAEPDSLHVVERATGKVVQSVPVASAPERMALTKRDRLDVTLYSGTTRRFRLDGFEDGPAKLVPLDPPDPDLYGGAGYGGAGYGGYGYGGASYGGYRRPTP